jgi:hypothetical protein
MPAIDPAIVAQMQQQALLFVRCQETLDYDTVASLFEPVCGTFYIPVGGEPVVGRENVRQNYKQFYAGLKSIREQIVGPILQSNMFLGFSKNILMELKDGTMKYRETIGWFEFVLAPTPGMPPLIKNFWAFE